MRVEVFGLAAYDLCASCAVFRVGSKTAQVLFLFVDAAAAVLQIVVLGFFVARLCYNVSGSGFVFGGGRRTR